MSSFRSQKPSSILMLLFAVCLNVPSLSQAAPLMGSGDAPPDNAACDFCQSIPRDVDDIPNSVDLNQIRVDCFAFFSRNPGAIDHIDRVYVPPPGNPDILNSMSTVLSGGTEGINSAIPEQLVTDGTLIIFPDGIESIQVTHWITLRSNYAVFKNEERSTKLRIRAAGSFNAGRPSHQKADALIRHDRNLENVYLDGLELTNVNESGTRISRDVKAFIQSESGYRVQNLSIRNVDFRNNPANTALNASLNRLGVSGVITMDEVNMDCRDLRSGQRCFGMECKENCGSSELSLSNLHIDLEGSNGRVFGISMVSIDRINIFNVEYNPSRNSELFAFSGTQATERCISNLTFIQLCNDPDFRKDYSTLCVGLAPDQTLDPDGSCFLNNQVTPSPVFCPLTTSAVPGSSATSRPVLATSSSVIEVSSTESGLPVTTSVIEFQPSSTVTPSSEVQPTTPISSVTPSSEVQPPTPISSVTTSVIGTDLTPTAAQITTIASTPSASVQPDSTSVVVTSAVAMPETSTVEPVATPVPTPKASTDEPEVTEGASTAMPTEESTTVTTTEEPETTAESTTVTTMEEPDTTGDSTTVVTMEEPETTAESTTVTTTGEPETTTDSTTVATMEAPDTTAGATIAMPTDERITTLVAMTDSSPTTQESVGTTPGESTMAELTTTGEVTVEPGVTDPDIMSPDTETTDMTSTVSVSESTPSTRTFSPEVSPTTVTVASTNSTMTVAATGAAPSMTTQPVQVQTPVPTPTQSEMPGLSTVLPTVSTGIATGRSSVTSRFTTQSLDGTSGLIPTRTPVAVTPQEPVGNNYTPLIITGAIIGTVTLVAVTAVSIFGAYLCHKHHVSRSYTVTPSKR